MKGYCLYSLRMITLYFFKTLVIQDVFDHVWDDHDYAKDDAHGDCE